MLTIKIILGSKNKSKKEAIELALNELNFSDFEIIPLAVDSHVSSKPINEETLIGAQNRNKELYNYCIENKIDFDLLISIEGGYEQIGNYFFIVTYASIMDFNGKEYIGKSTGLQITEKMFDWIKNGKSLNKVIEEMLSTVDNKKSSVISGFLTNGYYYRSYFDSTAVISAIQFMQNSDLTYKQLERRLKN